MKVKLISIILLIFGIMACSEDNTPIDPDLHGYNYKELVCVDTFTYVLQNIRLKAVAEGEGLTYNWSCSEGAIYGSGSEVIFSICHSTVVHCACIVTDKYNHKLKKEIKLEIKTFGPKDI